MIGILLVLVAHALDALTYELAVLRWGAAGEWGPLGLIGASVGQTLLLKAGGALVAAGIAVLLAAWWKPGHRWARQAPLAVAAGAGLLAAATNVASLMI